MKKLPLRLGALCTALLLAGCQGEEPPVQDSPLDEGGLYEDGALEQVQPVEPEIAPVDTVGAELPPD